jgi:uncharacterized protein YjbI with pentapeptide repeats
MTDHMIDAKDFLGRIERHRAWVGAGEPEDETENSDRLSLIDAKLEPINVSDTTFSSACLVRCDLSGSTFVRCDFSAAQLTGSVLRGCRFLQCEFRKAEVTDADCRAADFSGSGMTRVDLSRADLRGANLTGCDLGWAWLVRTDLRLATLEGVNLDGARLAGTRFFDTRRFQLAQYDRAIIQDIFVDEDAAGPPRSGPEALDWLRREFSDAAGGSRRA